MKPLPCLLLTLLLFGCTPPPKENKASASDPLTNSPTTAYSPDSASSPTPSRPESNSIYAEIDNQMSVEQLRKSLDEVEAIERESRRMVVLRRNWIKGAADCMEIMKRLKPRANAIRSEYKRMLSPAGMEIASAAMAVSVCVNCVENDDDTFCRDARASIRNAERELKKEMRQK